MFSENGVQNATPPSEGATGLASCVCRDDICCVCRQDICGLPRHPLGIGYTGGMSWGTTDVSSADTTDVLSAVTTDVLSADTTDVAFADTGFQACSTLRWGCCILDPIFRENVAEPLYFTVVGSRRGFWALSALSAQSAGSAGNATWLAVRTLGSSRPRSG